MNTDKNWLSLYGVIVAETFEEFVSAYKLSHQSVGGGRPVTCGMELWKVITGEVPYIGYEKTQIRNAKKKQARLLNESRSHKAPRRKRLDRS